MDRQAFGARGLREWIRKGGLGKDGGRKRQEKPPPSRLRERPPRPITITRLSSGRKERHCTRTSNARAREERLDKVAHLTRLLKIEHHMYISRVVSHFTDGRQRKKINRPISLLPLLLSPLPSNDTRGGRDRCLASPLFNTPCNVGHPRQAFLSTNQPGRPRRRNRQKKSSSTPSAPLRKGRERQPPKMLPNQRSSSSMLLRATPRGFFFEFASSKTLVPITRSILAAPCVV